MNKSVKMAYVYTISIDDKIIYVGLTNNYTNRTKQHMRAFYKDNKKYLYKRIKEEGFTINDCRFNCIKNGPILEMKRLEAFLILKDHFNEKQLWQAAPYSFKYF